jgi:hypothetical protein
METANAFDMLVLPMLQCFAGAFVTFPILHGIRVGLSRMFGESTDHETGSASR